MVRDHFPAVQIVANPTNVGYARGANQGMQRARGRFLLLLNADTTIQPGAIDALLEYMRQHPSTGIAGPRLVYPDGRLQYSCRTFYSLKTILMRRTFLRFICPNSKTVRHHLMSDWDHLQPRKVDWLVGAALLIRGRAMADVGLMDERYRLYFEDVDWCQRMHDAGWDVSYVPQSEIIHIYRQGSRKKNLLSRDVLVHLTSSIRYYDKWSRLLHRIRQAAQALRATMLVGLDLAAVFGAFQTAYKLIQSIGPRKGRPLFPPAAYQEPLLLFGATLVICSAYMGLYRGCGNKPWLDRMLLIIKTVMMSTLFTGLMMLTFFDGYRIGYMQSRLVLILTVVFTMAGIIGIRESLYGALRLLWRNGLARRRLVMVGPENDRTLADLRHTLENQPDLGFEFVGLITPEAQDRKAHAAPRPLLGSACRVHQICGRERIHSVVFADLERLTPEIIRTLLECRRERLSIKVLTNQSMATLIGDHHGSIGGFACYDYDQILPDRLLRTIKRTRDVVGALVMLSLALPAMLIIWGLLYRQAGGPFFKQTRVGHKGRLFSIYKFRTMLPQAADAGRQLANEEPSGRLFKVAHDPRVTPRGRWLRPLALDELPQLFNVLRGEMSLVGPRPALPEEVERYDEWHRIRLDCRPGMTGLWQVDRNRRWHFETMLDRDIYYMLNWSLWLDCKIILQTPIAILRNSRSQS
jgi:exopolysaccharide biosynthesis polyprenyl glycosylphosphotransferase